MVEFKTAPGAVGRAQQAPDLNNTLASEGLMTGGRLSLEEWMVVALSGMALSTLFLMVTLFVAARRKMRARKAKEAEAKAAAPRKQSGRRKR